ncbi:hypothetical protein ACOSQ3_028554 [Xanthoceras sorbifolium]
MSHIALLPSSGMGHLTPFLRLAALLTAHDLKITIITPYPTISLAESQFCLTFSPPSRKLDKSNFIFFL